MDKGQQKALKDFTAEAEEILDALAEDLDVGRDQFGSSGKVKPDRLNKIFREMHSLKGLASMVGLERITTLSHDLESLLDRVRLGKMKLNSSHFDILGESLNCLRSLVKESAHGEEKTEIGALLDRVKRAETTAPENAEKGREKFFLDDATKASLTEYEEHRLQDNIAEGNSLYSIRVGFDFSDFDTKLRALSERLNDVGESISTLPVVDPSLGDGIYFRLLVGTSKPRAELDALVKDLKGEVTELAIAPLPKAEELEIREEVSPEEVTASVDAEESAALEEVQGISNTVKVDIEKLDAVMGIVGELNLARSSLWKIAIDLQGKDTHQEIAMALVKQVRTIEKKLGELQRSIVDIRMVPISQIYSRLNRTARRLARSAGKEIEIRLYGGETELDKIMIDQLLTPLIHLIRNSIDHGIEPPAERVRERKPVEGSVFISAYQKGNSIVIEVTDDGRGLQYEKIRQAAIKKGILQEQAHLSPEECMELIFMPGFSSADKVTEVSGRGVGLDAVKASIESMKGSIALWSEPRQGTTFQITLPITLAIIQSLLVSCRGYSYAIPISSILETFRIRERDIQWLDRREVYDLRGVTLPLLRLEQRFGQQKIDRGDDDRVFVVVARRGEKAAGIIVDELLGEQETVVHPIGQRFSQIPGIAGATEVGENQVILVIDTASLFSTNEAVRV